MITAHTHLLVGSEDGRAHGQGAAGGPPCQSGWTGDRPSRSAAGRRWDRYAQPLIPLTTLLRPERPRREVPAAGGPSTARNTARTPPSSRWYRAHNGAPSDSLVGEYVADTAATTRTPAVFRSGSVLVCRSSNHRRPTNMLSMRRFSQYGSPRFWMIFLGVRCGIARYTGISTRKRI